MIAAFAIAAVLIFASIVVIVRFRPYAGRHVRDPFEATLDVTSQDARGYVAELAGIRPPSPEILARVRDRLLALPLAPRPDDTQPIPHAVGTWGMTAAGLAAALACEHMGAAG